MGQQVYLPKSFRNLISVLKLPPRDSRGGFRLDLQNF
jgi:hypothetical protein